jgi:hypothetical protein
LLLTFTSFPNGRADTGSFLKGKMSFSIAMVPVEIDQVPDLHAAPEGSEN